MCGYFDGMLQGSVTNRLFYRYFLVGEYCIYFPRSNRYCKRIWTSRKAFKCLVYAAGCLGIHTTYLPIVSWDCIFNLTVFSKGLTYFFRNYQYQFHCQKNKIKYWATLDLSRQSIYVYKNHNVKILHGWFVQTKNSMSIQYLTFFDTVIVLNIVRLSP